MHSLLQIERCIGLLHTNPGAARRFYQLAVVHLSPTEVTKFILAILSAIMHCVEGEGVRSGEVEGDSVSGGGVVNGDSTCTSIDSENEISEDERASEGLCSYIHEYYLRSIYTYNWYIDLILVHQYVTV